MSPLPRVTRIRDGEYIVEVDGLQHVVYVAGEPGDRWVHWDGQVFRRPFAPVATAHASAPTAGGSGQSCLAPMPAKVLKVLVQAGDAVHGGDTLVVLEAMKMELAVRAEADGVVTMVGCRAGGLVQAGAVLVELS